MNVSASDVKNARKSLNETEKLWVYVCNHDENEPHRVYADFGFTCIHGRFHDNRENLNERIRLHNEQELVSVCGVCNK